MGEKACRGGREERLCKDRKKHLEQILLRRHVEYLEEFEMSGVEFPNIQY